MPRWPREAITGMQLPANESLRARGLHHSKEVLGSGGQIKAGGARTHLKRAAGWRVKGLNPLGALFQILCLPHPSCNPRSTKALPDSGAPWVVDANLSSGYSWAPQVVSGTWAGANANGMDCPTEGGRVESRESDHKAW